METEIGDALSALAGGVLLGVGTSLLLAMEGLAEGVSGMVAGLLRGARRERALRSVFLLALIGTGGVAYLLAPAQLANTSGRPLLAFALAGLLIGYGARLANGCTSGHGVIGVSRGSSRSLLAVSLFVVSALIVNLFYTATQPVVERASRCVESAPCTAENGGEP